MISRGKKGNTKIYSIDYVDTFYHMAKITLPHLSSYVSTATLLTGSQKHISTHEATPCVCCSSRV